MEGLEVKAVLKFYKYFLYFTEKTYYYQGDFHISGVTYNDNCEIAISQASTDLSKDIETKVSQEFIYFIINLVKTYMVAFLFFLLTDVWCISKF